jgi:hypothetical protein
MPHKLIRVRPLPRPRTVLGPRSAPSSTLSLSPSVSCVSDCAPPSTRGVCVLGSSASRRLLPPPGARLRPGGEPKVSGEEALAAMVDCLDDEDLAPFLQEG